MKLLFSVKCIAAMSRAHNAVQSYKKQNLHANLILCNFADDMEEIKLSKPLFSIVTVTWNAASVLPVTITSIATQSCNSFEWLVIDGESTDGTANLARDADITTARVVSEPDNGLYDAMNKGIRLARGEYLIFLNAGDAFASPDVLARLARCATSHPDVIYGQTQLVDGTGTVIGRRHLTAPSTLDADSFKDGMVVCHQAFIAKRTLVPTYDLSYRFSADFDWCVRVLKSSDCNVYAGDQPIISYLQQGLTTANEYSSLLERFHIMCRHYGVTSTVMRHIGFIPRFLKRKLAHAL